MYHATDIYDSKSSSMVAYQGIWDVDHVFGDFGGVERSCLYRRVTSRRLQITLFEACSVFHVYDQGYEINESSVKDSENDRAPYGGVRDRRIFLVPHCAGRHGAAFASTGVPCSSFENHVQVPYIDQSEDRQRKRCTSVYPSSQVSG